MYLIDKYLVKETDETCAHCHKNSPEKGGTVCKKCKKELESWRNKKSKDKEE